MDLLLYIIIGFVAFIGTFAACIMVAGFFVVFLYNVAVASGTMILVAIAALLFKYFSGT